jgi:hypothetical protein
LIDILVGAALFVAVIVFALFFIVVVSAAANASINDLRNNRRNK